MKCVLVSFFNSNNLGDILIGESLYDQVLQKFNIVEKISYSGELEVSSNKHTEETTRNYKRNIIDLITKMGLSYVLRFYNMNFKKSNLDYFEDKIIDSNALVIGGGNMIFDLDKNSVSAKRFKEFVAIAKKHNKMIFAISLGIGPFQTIDQARYAIGALELCDHITFRDDASFKIFRKYNKTHNNVHVSIDPVFLLPRKTNDSSKDKAIALNIINSRLLGESEKQYYNVINQYTKLADNLVEYLGEKVVLFSTEIADYDAVYDVFESVKFNDRIEVIRIVNSEELFELYSNTLILVGTRMHAMIVAHSQHIPIIGLSWQQKVDSMFDIIESKESLFKYNEIDAKLDQIIDSAKAKINNIDVEKLKIKDNLIKIRVKNEINDMTLNCLVQQIEDK